MTSDFLVIGSGVAGLSFAIKAAEHGSVTLITKNDALNSNTAWAQGGISAVLPDGLRDRNDSIEKHVDDTLDAGAGLCNEQSVRTIIGEGARTIEELVAWGAAPQALSNEQIEGFLGTVYDGLMREHRGKPAHNTAYISWSISQLRYLLARFNALLTPPH